MKLPRSFPQTLKLYIATSITRTSFVGMNTKVSTSSSSRFTRMKRLLTFPKVARPGQFGRVFDYFDENSDGKISPAELRNYMQNAGEEMTVEEAEAVVVLNDTDGDGQLGFEDFVKMMEVDGDEKGRDVREAFKVYETVGKGYITPESLRRVLRRLGERRSVAECKKMIGRFDLDGDGVLSLEEFTVMMSEGGLVHVNTTETVLTAPQKIFV